MKGNRIRKITPYLYVAPALLLAFLFSYKPFFLTIIDSFFHVSANGNRIRFVGLENYGTLLVSGSFRDSWRNTLRFALFFVPLNLVITYALAFLTSGEGRGARVSRSLLMLPVAVSMSSAVLIFKMLFDENVGLINRILGRHVPWFSDAKAAMTMLVLVGVWLDIGFDFILFSSSISAIPRSLREVAALEGASPLRRFLSLDLPMTSPTIFFVFCSSLKDAILICSPVMILTEGGPFRSTQTLIYHMYTEGFKSGNIAMASAICAIVFLVLFAVLLLLLSFQKRRVFYQ